MTFEKGWGDGDVHGTGNGNGWGYGFDICELEFHDLDPSYETGCGFVLCADYPCDLILRLP